MGIGIALSMADAQRNYRQSIASDCHHGHITITDMMSQIQMDERKERIKSNLRKWYSSQELQKRESEIRESMDEMEFIGTETNMSLGHIETQGGQEKNSQQKLVTENITAKGQLERTELKRRVQTSSLLIEAITEDLMMKNSLFELIGKLYPKADLIASNTSSISISQLSQSLIRNCPDHNDLKKRMIGMHFMNPVPRMPLIEIISGLDTSQETKQKACDIAQWMRKEVGFSLDFPGFISNRILMPYINEAILAYQEGIGSLEHIDKIMKLGTNVSMGPLQLADFIGLDTCLSILRILENGIGERFHPAPLLVQYVNSGRLGRKTNKGFYEYK